MSEPLTADHVRQIAKLSRLTLTDAEVESYRTQLSRVLGYFERLAALDVAGVEPMSHPPIDAARLRADEAGPTLPPGTLRAMAPAMHGEFVSVPKVLGDTGDGGGA